MNPKGIAEFLSPQSAAALLAHYEENSPFVVHDLGDALSPLTDLPFLQSLEALLSLWPHAIQAYTPQVADEVGAVDVTPEGARRAFAEGRGLIFDEAQRVSPILTLWLEAIRQDLGLSSLTQSRCLIYATAKGEGTAPHFDQNVNFVVQVTGTKKWWVAPNHNVVNPLSRHTMGLPADPELQTYVNSPLPTTLAADSELMVLKPGSLLFVPRGCWHATEAESDALSLNFTYSAPAWLDILAAALRSRLALSEEWRETANGVSSNDPQRREAAEQRFEQLLSELTLDLPNWSAAAILGVTDTRD